MRRLLLSQASPAKPLTASVESGFRMSHEHLRMALSDEDKANPDTDERTLTDRGTWPKDRVDD